MPLQILLIVVGLGSLLIGGEWLVRGSSAVARKLGIAPVVIGLTIVAFGTSSPELIVNLAASFKGNGEIGFGNIVGSNIANIALLLGLTALIKPIVAHPSIVTREIPMMVLAALVGVVLAYDQALNAWPVDVWSRGDGLVFLLLFGVFMYYTIADALRQRETGDPYAQDVDRQTQGMAKLSATRCALLIVGGLAALGIGGELTVRGATGLARGLGVPEVVIGLTLVAVGTSLPEMVTSIIAARKGQSDLALGNIVGSNIFNILFITGLSSTIYPEAIPPRGHADLWVMLVFSVLLLPMAITDKRTITRAEGAVLLTGYTGYVGYLAYASL
ncbi:MAG: calcium/sodium antiporter [Phycisphaera sp.]|nr:calcium/sodium antiporter [Phycisphaera sp.]